MGRKVNVWFCKKELKWLKMRQIPDLMLCLQELTDGSVRSIRKTAEDPPRVAEYLKLFHYLNHLLKVERL